MRDGTLEALDRLLDRYTRNQDCGVITSAEASILAEDLLRRVQGMRPGLLAWRKRAQAIDILASVGTLYWHRHLCSRARPDVKVPPDVEDVGLAIACFVPLSGVRPELVPPDLRRYLDVVRPGPSGEFGLESTQANALIMQVMTRDDPPALNAAIIIYEQLFGGAPAGHPYRAELLSNLAIALMTRATRTGSLADLERAVDLCERGIGETSDDDPDRAGRLANLSVMLGTRFEQGGSPDDLNRAIACAEQALGGLGDDHPDRGGPVSNLGMLLRHRFDLAHDVADLDRAVRAGETSVAATPVDHPDYVMRLYNLAATYHSRYATTQDLADLGRSVDLAERAVAACPLEHPHRADLLGMLGAAMTARARRTDDLTTLNTAIGHLEDAVGARPGDPHGLEWMAALEDALVLRHDRQGRPADIDRAVALATEIVAATPEDGGRRRQRLHNQATALRIRFEITDSIDDLDRSVELSRESVATGPDGDPGTVTGYMNLATSLQVRFDRTGDPADLDAAVDAGERAAAAVPPAHPERARILSELGIAFDALARRTREEPHLDRALELCSQAVAATPTGSPTLRGHLVNLAICLSGRHEVTGVREEIDRAVEIGERAINSGPADSVQAASARYNTANAYLLRYTSFGEIADLHRAVDYGELAVDGLPADDRRGRASYLSDFANALLLRYWRLRHPADLDAAVRLADECVAVTPSGDADLGRRQDNAGSAHRIRALANADRTDADRAVEMHDRAVALVRDGRVRAGILSNLAATLRLRFALAGDPADLARAIDVGEQAIDASDSGPSRARYMVVLGVALMDRHAETGDPADLERAERLFRDSAELAASPVSRRAEAANLRAEAAAERGDWAESVRAFDQAVRLLGEVAPRSLERSDQEHGLAQLSGLGSRAAEACLQAGLPDRAVELLEHGRNVLFAQLLESRADLAELAATHPDMAGAVDRLMRELDRPEPKSVGSAAVAELDARRRRDAYAELQTLLRHVRALPGFDRFLMPPPAATLLAAARDAPVVLLNVAPRRSDAIILRHTGIDVITLADATPDRVVEQADVFLRALDEEDEDRVSDVLGWLWESIARPVLDACGFTHAPAAGEPWPRIRWCPSGPLAVLSIHAAGRHETRFSPQPETVIDRVISSTVPNLRTLLRASRAPGVPAPASTLVVAMPTTPDERDLPGAAREAALLAELLPGRVDVVGLPGTPPATYDSVTAALPDHAWTHFSCHGATDMRDPSASRLLLQDHRTRPLNVLDLQRARLDGADLAFLSACSTARAGVDLPDESIHLAAACLLAGYRHVVATLWPIEDTDAVTVARTVYTSLLAPGDGATPVARAVHDGTRALRFLYPSRPSRWATHVHIGP